ncbi:acetyl-CoA carboxylase biotin carboxyl carrier protein [Enterococcus thailandicus]|uniref:acetyl-CoA carboxylase biotin carboxyl carrier protein n=1 Tax=Enterococcus thailandicus TaxID=417368 RepID=UPI0022EBE236|nr:acetyl-CoA carboxylase biotin carboxyl carrier protein [Enterococcus thailandicus]MDA3973546.1 acetyl-CoA carboxylase biotin carboxyl carrier protein [Enterococcus thailandicus]MDA3975869.1 acetyl-CoA carboxylase biotin carboxyl carrier protein [Enterococcus thailandicus]MDA3981005.1 acetyl-CoA carboxylase biotin carboxyl carrier protein [Enterococcus thailandicus]
MNISEIKELVTQFDQSSLTEFDLREGQFELYMNKNNTSRGTVTAPQTMEAPAVQPVSVKPEIKADEPVKEQTVVADTKQEIEGIEVKSPIVGVVYLQPSPDKPAYKKVGDQVAKGEIICIIEAMKLMNEITSDFDGEIVEILAENEEVVEFGQPLVKIQPK